MNLLFIEDNKELLDLIKHALSSDHIIKTCTSGKDGLFSMIQEKPDIIFLDIMMKGLNGFDVLRMIRKDKQNSGIPVYIISALIDDATIQKTKSMGANGYIKKPFKLTFLKEFLDKISMNEINFSQFMTN